VVRGNQSVPRLCHFISSEGAHSTHRTRGCVGPRAGLVTVAERPLSLSGMEPRFLSLVSSQVAVPNDLKIAGYPSAALDNTFTNIQKKSYNSSKCAHSLDSPVMHKACRCWESPVLPERNNEYSLPATCKNSRLKVKPGDSLAG
jgi:hypothetical protein